MSLLDAFGQVLVRDNRFTQLTEVVDTTKLANGVAAFGCGDVTVESNQITFGTNYGVWSNPATKSLRSSVNLDADNRRIAAMKLTQVTPPIFEKLTKLADDIESTLMSNL